MKAGSVFLLALCVFIAAAGTNAFAGTRYLCAAWCIQMIEHRGIEVIAPVEGWSDADADEAYGELNGSCPPPYFSVVGNLRAPVLASQENACHATEVPGASGGVRFIGNMPVGG